MTEKEIKSVDISSFTVISTGIATLISILVSLIIVAVVTLTVPDSFATMLYTVPTIVFGTIICGIFLYFSEAYLYNIITKKLGAIKVDIGDNGYIKKISPKETALIAAAIALIILVVVYLALSLILPLFITSLISTLMYASQTDVAYILYQYLFVFGSPSVILTSIIATVIILSVFTLLGVYIYNLLATSERGIIVELSKEDKYTAVDSVNPTTFAIAIAAISLILNIIAGLIMIISGTEIFAALTSILFSFIVAFIEAAIIAVFYNFLAPRIGKLKLELI